MSLWTRDATMRYLTAHPLPVDFRWPHRDSGDDVRVLPSHSEVTAYGKWLRETPYFPGLFELCHDVLESVGHVPDEKWPPADPDWLPGEIIKLRKKAVLTAAPSVAPLAHRLRALLAVADQPLLPLN